jgi:hypothetical protein
LNNIEGESIPEFVKNLKGIIKPPSFKMKKGKVVQMEKKFMKDRMSAFKSKKLKDPSEIIRALDWDPLRYSIPQDIYAQRGERVKNDISIDYLEIPEDNTMSLREYMKATQKYGCFSGMSICVNSTEDELDRKLGEWLTFPSGDNGFCVSMLSQIPKAKIRSWIKKSTGVKLETLRLLTEKVEQWTPHFIPGKGTVVRFSKVFQTTMRVTEENFGKGMNACPEYAFELAHLVDSGTAQWIDIEFNIGELYFQLQQMEEEYDPKINTYVEIDGSEGDDPQSGEPPIASTSDQRTDEERAAHLAYLKYQIAGVQERMVYQLSPETRQEYLQSGGAANVISENVCAFDDLDSDDDALGGMFGD